MTLRENSGERFREALVTLLYARFPLLYVRTHEEDRLLEQVQAAVGDRRLAEFPRRVFAWRATTGLSDGSHRIVQQTRDSGSIVPRSEPGSPVRQRLP
jgi:hypothetical protein